MCELKFSRKKTQSVVIDFFLLVQLCRKPVNYMFSNNNTKYCDCHVVYIFF